MAESAMNVKAFEFNSFDEDKLVEGVKLYDMQEINGQSVHNRKPKKSEIRQERVAAKSTGFKMEDAIYEHRGLREQEKQDFENKVESEVEKRLSERLEQATKDGYEEGKKEGFDKSFSEANESFSNQLGDLALMIQEIQEHKKEIFAKNQLECFEMVRALTKWVLIKELDGGDYLERLLEKLVLEIGTKSNLLVKVNKSSFALMPDVLSSVESKIGELVNVRVEVDREMNQAGIMLESESSILNGDLKSQFRSIDNVFESVGLKNDPTDINSLDFRAETVQEEITPEEIIQEEEVQEQENEDSSDDKESGDDSDT